MKERQLSAAQIRWVQSIGEGGNRWLNTWFNLTHSIPGWQRLQERSVDKAKTVAMADAHGEHVHGTPSGLVQIGGDGRAYKVQSARPFTAKGKGGGQRLAITLTPARRGVIGGDGIATVHGSGYIDLADWVQGFDASNNAQVQRHANHLVVILRKPTASGHTITRYRHTTPAAFRM